MRLASNNPWSSWSATRQHKQYSTTSYKHTHTHTHTRLTALFPRLSGWAGIRKVKAIWILLKQETVSGSGINWAICKSAHRSRQITTPAPHHSVFYRPDALPAAQPTVSKHWRDTTSYKDVDKSEALLAANRAMKTGGRLIGRKMEVRL